jgi:tetratricopeptide (TPR) repeat protein
MNILYNGVELCRSSTSGLTAAAYILESWKKFNDAIELYKIILKDTENKSMVQRDLALAYYQNGQYQLAVNEYYNILIAQNEYYNYNHIKELALDEMNAVIAAHKKELDISFINTNMIRSLPVDLRVTAESSSGYIYNFRIQEPNGNVSSVNSYDVKKEGRVITATGYYGYGSVNEYAVKKARSGRYHIKIDSYETESNGEGKIPVYLRTIVFKNFQQENQQIQVQNISLDNQYGTVETGSIDW